MATVRTMFGASSPARARGADRPTGAPRATDAPTTRRAARRPLVVVAAACLTGIALDELLHATRMPHPLTLSAWWTLAWTAAAAAWSQRDRGRGGWFVVIALAALGGTWRHCWWHYFQADDLARFATFTPQPACLRGVVVEGPLISPAQPPDPLQPVERGPQTEITLANRELRDGDAWRTVGGRTRIRIDGVRADLRPGLLVEVAGEFRRVPPPLNPGQTDWSAVARGRRQLCEAYCPHPEGVTPLGRAGVPASGWLYDLRRRSVEQLRAHIAAPYSPLAEAILLGVREQLEPDDLDAFLHTGTIHLLVISGLHVGLLAAMTWCVARGLGLRRTARLATTASATCFYAALAGGTPPILRATTVTLAMLAALALGRRTSRLNALAGAALVVVAVNPTEAARPGAQLSFLSVAALLWLGGWASRPRPLDPLQKLLAETASWPRRAARWMLASAQAATLVSLAVWAITTPLVAHHFQLATPIGVVLTPLAWPLVATALAAGLALLTIGWLVPWSAPPLGALCSAALKGAQWLVDQGESLPYGRFYGPGPPAWWLLPLYLALAAWAIVPPTRRPPPRRAAAALTLWCLVGLVVIGRPPARGQQVDCTFLALGHGGCFVAQWPDGSTLMYDAGSMIGPRSASRTIAEFLWSRGIRRIDDLLLSHADVDHYNAIPALLERFAVGRIYAPPQLAASCAEASADAAPRLLATAIDRSGTPWANLEAGDAVSLAGGQAAVRVLHPSAGADGASDNALSLVVELEIWGRRLLLTGDLESAGLDRVVASPIGQCDVVLAPHHGSMRSAPVAMAAWSRPRWVVISGKALEEHQATRGAYAAAGARVLHTSEQGAVMVAITPEHVAVTSHLSSPLEARRQQSVTRSAGGRGAGTAAANLPPIN